MTDVYEFTNTPVNTIANANPPGLATYFANKRWSVKFLLWISGGAGTWGRFLCHGASYTSTFNWSLGVADTGTFFIEVNDQSWSFASDITIPENQWLEMEAGWDGVNVYLDINGTVKSQAQADWPIPALEDGFIVFDDLNASSARRIQISNIRHTLNDDAMTVTYLCNEGGGTTFTEEDQGYNGTLTDIAIHATAEAGHPGLGAPTTGQFTAGTSDDGSVTGWQWEESSDDINWANAGAALLTNISGQTTQTLTITTATLAENGTYVRLKATGAGFASGIFSNSAQLIVNAA